MSGTSGPLGKAAAWAMFDRIVEQAAADEGPGVNPWRFDQAGPVFAPDYATLRRLLAVPLLLGSTSQSGIPALALDVWTAYELRRAGFDPDRVWPRARPPRILPSTLSAVQKSATQRQRAVLAEILASGKTYDGETGASANILGKNYVKQVDVVISSWNTGPELMISTKRMDSSFGNNAANRVEESYGDAKNLRSRHPQAALGFVYSLSSTAFTPENRRVADWIVDLLGKLGREDDAYDAVALIVPDLADRTHRRPTTRATAPRMLPTSRWSRPASNPNPNPNPALPLADAPQRAGPPPRRPAGDRATPRRRATRTTTGNLLRRHGQPRARQLPDQLPRAGPSPPRDTERRHWLNSSGTSTRRQRGLRPGGLPARWRGNCLARLGEMTAIDSLMSALDDMGEGQYGRAEVSLRVDLALAFRARGDVVESQLHARRAGDLAGRTGSQRQRRRIAQLLSA